MQWWQAPLAVAGGLVLLWVVLLGALWGSGRGQDPLSVRETLRLLPDVIRLLRGLGGDRSLPRGVRIRLWLLLGYLLTPIDLVPDVIPVIGYADDAIVVALALHAVVRAAGPEALRRHWSGHPSGLNALLRLAGIPS
jgi:uncharacterized membrane protein YkvA (DUF1232 family)